MDASLMLLLIVMFFAIVGAAALAGIEIARRRYAADLEPGPSALDFDAAVQAAMRDALTEMRVESAADQSAMMKAAFDQAARAQREQFGSVADEARRASASELNAKKDVIDSRLDQVTAEMRAELGKLGQMVSGLAESSAEKFGEVDRSLRSHAEITATLSDSARALREAMANPSARGQWGERMAEDVLRLAGFVEHVNYTKQSQVEGGTGRPDFTFPLPKGHELYMDVKFPMAAYLRYLDAGTDAERSTHRAAFVKDVRARVRELAKRDYARESARKSVDYVLLFLPNETLTGFIHQNDPKLIDDAMEQRVVMCSPLTLFAFLGVIRQAHDNFVIEQTSDEILQLIGRFGQQWQKYNDQLDKVKTKFDQLDTQFDALVGTRRRALAKPLAQLEGIRRKRNLPIEGEPFADEPDAGHETGTIDEVDETPVNVRRLGA